MPKLLILCLLIVQTWALMHSPDPMAHADSMTRFHYLIPPLMVFQSRHISIMFLSFSACIQPEGVHFVYVLCKYIWSIVKHGRAGLLQRYLSTSSDGHSKHVSNVQSVTMCHPCTHGHFRPWCVHGRHMYPDQIMWHSQNVWTPLLTGT